jgi:hypothetical protein
MSNERCKSIMSISLLVRVRTGWDGIFTAFMPWMTSTEAPYAQVHSLPNAMNCDSFLGIGGTAGVEPAVIAQKRTETGLVTREQKYHQATH